ncbi:MAG TPA: hypothetical protein VFN49_11990 [Candidatus Aquilonibacter sp.]|nr:hypothetical protein [Candidatus Aquilonibacter sp.]
MPVFFVVAISALLIAIVDLFLGAWLATLVALVFWTLSVLALGNGIEWDRRLMVGSAYAAMIVAECAAVAGLWIHR